jgi:hypothetical protein
MPNIRAMYPTFGMLQAATNLDSVPMAFLASDDAYSAVRDLELRNLIVPVVGDFGGPKAIRAVGEYLWKRGLTVTAFYLSNVEQYLFRDAGAADRFYANVSALPTDSTSQFIRSVPGTGGSMFGFGPGGIVFGPGSGGGAAPGNGWTTSAFSITIFDSAGRRMIRTVQDSAGTRVVRLMQDTTGQMVVRRPDSTRTFALRRDSAQAGSLQGLLPGADSALRQLLARSAAPAIVMRGGLLTSGLATIHGTLEAFFARRLTTYQDVIAMTKTGDWR